MCSRIFKYHNLLHYWSFRLIGFTSKIMKIVSCIFSPIFRIIFLSSSHWELFSTASDHEVSLISPTIVSQTFLGNTLWEFPRCSSRECKDDIFISWGTPDDVILHFLGCLGKPVQDFVIHLRMFWGGNCTTRDTISINIKVSPTKNVCMIYTLMPLFNGISLKEFRIKIKALNLKYAITCIG